MHIVTGLFDVGVFPFFDRSNQRVLKAGGEPAFLIREWGSARLLHQVPWLKRQNKLGANVYIRPNGSGGLILLDDLSFTMLNRIEDDGIVPACIVETSPLNYQAWIRVSEEAIQPDLASGTAKALAIRYGADLNSADWRHFGRLAGFTNRKPKHVNEVGQYPFVILRSARQVKANAELLELGRQQLLQDSRKQKQFTVLSGERVENAVEYFQQSWVQITKAMSGETDCSQVDWLIVCNMVRLRYSKQDIFHALLQASPNLCDRKQGHVEDYISRTIEKAAAQFCL